MIFYLLMKTYKIRRTFWLKTHTSKLVLFLVQFGYRRCFFLFVTKVQIGFRSLHLEYLKERGTAPWPTVRWLSFLVSLARILPMVFLRWGSPWKDSIMNKYCHTYPKAKQYLFVSNFNFDMLFQILMRNYLNQTTWAL